MSLAHFVGQVIARNVAQRAVQVQVPSLKMDNFLKMYFTENVNYWTADPKMTTKEGDIVRIRSMSEPQSDVVQHEIREIVYPKGQVMDPFTGRRCKGPQFHEKELEDIATTGKMKAGST